MVSKRVGGTARCAAHPPCRDRGFSAEGQRPGRHLAALHQKARLSRSARLFTPRPPAAEISALAETADAQVAELSSPREGEADLRLADLAPASQLVQVGGVLSSLLGPWVVSSVYCQVFLLAAAWCLRGCAICGQDAAHAAAARCCPACSLGQSFLASLNASPGAGKGTAQAQLAAVRAAVAQLHSGTDADHGAHPGCGRLLLRCRCILPAMSACMCTVAAPHVQGT